MLMGRDKLKVIDVARAIDVHRNTVTLLYNEEAKRIDIETMDKLCRLFKCTPCDIFEYIEDDQS
jgi:putative transcriptional regulator